MLSRTTVTFLSCLALILIGSSLANYIHTAGGQIDISDVRFTTPDGGKQSALLYKPKSATQEQPAPGVLAIHGYINSRETQSGFAIELARRGFVVLAIDQSGHGYTDPPAFANAFGAPNALRYLRSLQFVDKSRIGLEGHSMGGWASRAATQIMPDSYHSLVMVGSSTTQLAFGNFSGTPTDPKNTAVVFSLYDEFGQMMWRTLPQDVHTAPAMNALFGTEESVEPNRLYGSIENGTARKLYQPATTHPGDHISPEAILNSVEWLQLTLNQHTSIPADDHIFLWKEIGTLIAFIGLVIAIFPLTKLIINLPAFSSLQNTIPANVGARGFTWWLGAVLTSVIPAATFFVFYNWSAGIFPSTSFWPQNITSGIAGWALLNGAITLIALAATVMLDKNHSRSFMERFGLDLSSLEIAKTFVVALLIIGGLAAITYIIQGAFLTDFRFWVVALKPASWTQWKIAFAYWPLFFIFFLIFSVNFIGPLRRTQAQGHELSLAASLLINSAIACSGFLILLTIQYSSLFSSGSLVLGESLLTIVAIQFVPLLIIIACVTTYCFRLSGHAYLGAFVNSMFVTWYIVAGQATHVV